MLLHLIFNMFLDGAYYVFVHFNSLLVHNYKFYAFILHLMFWVSQLNLSRLILQCKKNGILKLFDFLDSVAKCISVK
jgi:hypothetical protein